MSSQTQIVQSLGIFHGLSTYPQSPATTDLTAIVTGANGMGGHHMLKVLLNAPWRWKKIYCLSRKPPQDRQGITSGDKARVEHVAVDFLSSAEDVGEVLKEKQLRA